MHRGFKNIIWILFLLAWGCSKAPLPPDSENNVIDIDGDGKGEIQITTIDVDGASIKEAKIFLNGDFVGKSPTVIKGVPFGLHTLRAQKEGYEIYSETVTVESELAISRELILRKPPLNTGQLLVTVNVDSAKTTVTNAHNEVIRETFAKEMSMTLDIGGYFIRCEKPGYQLVNKAIAIRLDSTTSENITLEKVPDTSLPQIKTVLPGNGLVDSPVLISWESVNAQRVDIDYVENPGLSGKREVIFKSTGLHVVRFTAYNDFGEVSVSDSIVIEEMPNEPPIIELQFNPSEIMQNELATINWHSQNATEVAIDYVPNPSLSGQWQAVFPVTGTIIVNAYAYGPGGTAQDADTLFVRPKQVPAPTISVSVEPEVATIDQSVIIQWESENANSVDVDFVPAPGKSGQWQTSFSEKGIIVVSAHAYNESGKATAADTIRIVEQQPPTLNMTITPNIVDFGRPTTINWNSNGHKVIIDHGIGTRGPVGSEEVVFMNPGLKKITIVAYGDDKLKTIKSDTVRVNEPEEPELPVISLSVPDSVQVDKPATIEWHSMNASDVDIDYVQSPGLNGKDELVFQTPGRRIISATAYNHAGKSTTKDTLYVVSIPVAEQIETIYVASGAKVCAVHYSGIQSIDAADVYIKASGYYRITAAAFYNSGNSQKNESFYLTVTDASGMSQTPVDANAGQYKVVPDDPGSPHVAERDAGLFYFSEGMNKIRLNHYYLIADQYPQFVVNGPITDAESIEILFFRLEFVKSKKATRYAEGN